MELPFESCRVPTGSKWGKKLANVRLKGVPRNMVAHALVRDEGDLMLVFYRWDVIDEDGWGKPFEVKVILPDNTESKVIVPSSFQLQDGHGFRVPIRVNEKTLQDGRIIPRTLFMLSPPIETRQKCLRRSIENAREMTDVLQCTVNYYILGDEECRKEIESADFPGIAEAYHTLVPGSYKADLVRYYLLWKYGGIYMDDKSILRHSIDSHVFDSFMIGKDGKATDFFVSSMPTGVPEIAFMGARQGSPIMKKTLELLIENVRNRVYSVNDLGITGNYLLREVFRGSSFRLGYSEVKWRECLEETVANLKMANFSFDDIEVDGELLWHRSAVANQFTPKAPTYYRTLWNNRQVYVDGNPPVPLSTQLFPLITTVVGLLFAFGFFYFLSRVLT